MTAAMTDESEIRALQRKWFQATMHGDAETIGQLMTDDVVFLSPGRAPMDRSGFFDSFKAMKDHVSIHCAGEYTEVIVKGDFAYAMASLDVTVKPNNGGATIHLAGNTLSVFRREADGRWKLARDANLLMPQST